MTALRGIFVTGLLGVWMAAGWAQQAPEESSADAQTQREDEAQIRQEAEARGQQEVEVESVPPAAGASTESGAPEQVEAMADAGQTIAGTADGAVAIPEIAPLDELFVPSLGLRADEPWNDMPVDF